MDSDLNGADGEGVVGDNNRVVAGSYNAVGDNSVVDARRYTHYTLLDLQWLILGPERRSRRVLDRLVRAVTIRWSEEADHRHLNSPQPPLPIGWGPAHSDLVPPWSDIEEAAAHAGWKGRTAPPAKWAGTPQDLTGKAALGEVLLDRVPTRRLVVLGGPGAGKTTLLAQTSLEIIKARKADPAVPIPILLSVTTWDPAKQPDPWDWMTDRIAAEYVQVSHRDTDKLREDGQLLPILDGLDEITDSAKAVALSALNDHLRQGEYIVLSSRAEDYRRVVAGRTVKRLTGAAGVEIAALTARDVAAFLSRDADWEDARWGAVLCGPDTPDYLVEVFSRPLTVDLARTIYHPDSAGSRPHGPARRPEELLKLGSFRMIEEHLFDGYLPAAYRGTPPSGRHWPAARAQRWLAFLANRAMDPPERAATDFMWWRLPRLVPAGMVGIVLGVLPAAAVGVVAAVIPHLGSGLGVGLLLAWLAGGLSLFVARSTPTIAGFLHPRIVRWRPPIRESVGIGAGIAGGFLGGAVGGLLGGLAGHLLGVHQGLTGGVMGGLGVGVGTGAVFGPWRGLLASLCGGLGVGLCTGLWPGVPAGLLDGLGAWISAAVTIELKAVDAPAQGLAGVRVLPMFGVAATVGPAIGYLVSRSHGLALGLLVGLAVGVFGGLAGAVEGKTASLSAAADPRSVFVRDRSTFIATGLFGGVAFGIGAAFGVAWPVGVAGGLTVGLMAAAVRTCWGSYSVARLWLALRGDLPWCLMSFMRDAHIHRGILRQVGAAYQFRHVELQRHLTDRSSRPGDPEV